MKNLMIITTLLIFCGCDGVVEKRVSRTEFNELSADLIKLRQKVEMNDALFKQAHHLITADEALKKCEEATKKAQDEVHKLYGN